MKDALTLSSQVSVAAATAQFQSVESFVVGLGEKTGGGVCVSETARWSSPHPKPLPPFLPQFSAAWNLPGMGVTTEKEAMVALGRTQAMEQEEQPPLAAFIC